MTTVGPVFANPNAVQGEPTLRRLRELSAKLRVFAWLELRHRGLEPGIRQSARSIEPRMTTVKQRPCEPCFREAEDRQPPASSVVSPCPRTGDLPFRTKRLACAPSRQRPAPPALFTRSSLDGIPGLSLGDAPSGRLGRPSSYEASHLLWGFAPRRTLLAGPRSRRRLAYRSFGPCGPTNRSPRA